MPFNATVHFHGIVYVPHCGHFLLALSQKSIYQ